jgi:hypothetical protein
MRNSLFQGAVFLLLLPLCSCQPGREDQARAIEKEIRASVVSEIPALASLTCVFPLTYTNFQENYVVSDDIYIQLDEAALDYGYEIDESAIRVVFEGGRNVLRVRLPKGKWLSINRYTLNIEKTHDYHRPEDDIDAAMNRQLESLEKEYGERAIKEAALNIKNFFRVIAAKYALELDFAFE